MKKTIFIIFLLISFLYLQYSLGVLNPRSIKINNIKIDTPYMYYIYNEMKNFEILDITCRKKPWCEKDFTLDKNQRFNNIIVFYQNILFSDKITLSFTEVEKSYIDKFKNTFFNDKINLQIGKCLVNKKFKEDLYDYSIQLNNIFIEIHSSEKSIAEQYLEQLCNETPQYRSIEVYH